MNERTWATLMKEKGIQGLEIWICEIKYLQNWQQFTYNKLLKKGLETFFHLFISGNMVNSVNQMWCHWKAHVLTFPTISHSLQSLHFWRRDDPPNMGGSQIKFDQIQHFQCSKFLSSKVRKQPSIHLYFKDSVLILLPLRLRC